MKPSTRKQNIHQHVAACKVLRLDAIGGASGDMILAALIGLGADHYRISRSLRALKPGKFSIKTTRTLSAGISGLRVDVLAPSRHHHSRGLREISTMIRASRLPDGVKDQSLAVFRRLAEAEAKVHGTTPEEIHFHEVGAVDSIVDVVGSCLAMHMLGIGGVCVGSLPCGIGTIKADHGNMPNPAPATAELLRGFEVELTDEPFELVTPTAAALLSTWCACTEERPISFPAASWRIAGVSTAVGHRTLHGRSNTLRAMLLQQTAPDDAGAATSDKCLVMETNIDDMSPELLAPLFGKLLKAEALDVFTAPIQMKKQRTGILLTVLCDAEHRDRILNIVFRETTTFGVREYEVARTMLVRRIAAVPTPYGKVRVKIGTWRDQDVTVSPEYDDCFALSEKHGIPVRVVYDSACRTARTRLMNR